MFWKHFKTASLSLSLTHTHTHTHTHTLTHTHAHTLTLTHTLTRSRTHTHTHTRERDRHIHSMDPQFSVTTGCRINRKDTKHIDKYNGMYKLIHIPKYYKDFTYVYRRKVVLFICM
jgi:hypothetical protein